MRKSIDTYVQSIARDNAEFIKEGEYESIADYIIRNADTIGWAEFFDDYELEKPTYEPTNEQIESVKVYINDNYNYLLD